MRQKLEVIDVWLMACSAFIAGMAFGSTLGGCAMAHETAPACWYSGTQTDAPDRAHCFDTFDECTAHAARWSGDPWACEP